MIDFPNAKINLGLNVIEKRTDGYHNIESIFLPIELNDILEVIFGKDINNPYTWINSGLIIDTPPENNICIKALKLIKQKGFNIPAIEIQLYKNIPFGAGLGGGSADGAFMLKLLNNSFNLGISNNELKQMAIKLGADCSFFLDNKPAFVTGIGNIINPIEIKLDNYFIGLVIPNIHISTPMAYQNIKPKQPQTNLLEAIKYPIKEWKNTIFNDFELSVFNNFPEIKTIKDDLYRQGAIYASMSGSGSSVYGIFDSEPQLNYPNLFTWSGKVLNKKGR
ncbi:MAG: 4-(cytidine 5'-diphospho)-2-C-methyl-D-erythritol kinase [Marinilabiliaceae bacterium]|nr:4-(cytidine 5'-diphospho)-2-C-methyl-D-erythritol kinase [Marinilabiliaceae bacterium]